MSIIKIIIFGSNGMLGRYIHKYFDSLKKYEIYPITRKDFDINVENLPKLDTFLKKYIDESTCVINCAGLIPQRSNNICEYNYYVINTAFPVLLSKICKKYGAKMIQPTTDCVFDGSLGNYTENDEHSEKSNYGISKSLGEPHECTVIRSSIIGEEVDNKVSLLEWVKNSKGTINGWNNHLWNGVTCLQYSKILHQIIKDNIFWEGVMHIYSPVTKSKYELACIIKDVYDLNIQINETSAGKIVDKTLKSIHKTNDLFNIPPLEKQIKDIKDFSHILNA